MAFGSDQDKIKQYLDARYISASESSWHLFRYNMHEESPNVVCLAVHLPNEQPVIFNANEQPVMVLNLAGAKDTTLTAFFKKMLRRRKQKMPILLLDQDSIFYEAYSIKNFHRSIHGI